MSDQTSSKRIEFSAPREIVISILQVVGRAISSRSSVQILSGIYLKAEGKEVRVSATDMELSLTAHIEATVESEGSIVVPGRVLLDIVRVLPPGDVTFSQPEGENTIEITCGSASYKIHTYDPTDFPNLPSPEIGKIQNIPQAPFLETLKIVSRASSSDESRPVLTGILVRLSKGRLVMAATDSYRLSVKEKSIEIPEDLEIDAILPARALAEISRIGSGSEKTEELQLVVHENQILIGCEKVWLSTRRIDGQFPNYEQLKPEKFEAEMRASREELADVTRRVSVLAQQNTAMRLSLSEGQLQLRAQTQDIGEAEEAIPVSFSGEPIEIGFNPAFFLEGLESIQGDEVVLSLINPLRPGLISGGEDDFWYLIMPIRLSN